MNPGSLIVGIDLDEAAFWRQVAMPVGREGCWIWMGAIQSSGYGITYVGRGRGRQRRAVAHRVAYELFVGPIPDGLVLDHLIDGPCVVGPTCVNPAHVEPVTPEENRRRQAARQTHCRAGHPFSGANLQVAKGRRYCRTCRAARSRECYQRKAA